MEDGQIELFDNAGEAADIGDAVATDAADGGIEAAFARAEAEADAALKAAAALTRHLKRFHGAARLGNVRDLETAADAARQGITALDRTVTGIGKSWSFDGEGYLRGGGFSAELIERARQADLRISELDNRLYSHPALIQLLPGDRALMIDKKRERRLRPSVLIDVLRDLQRRPPRFRSADFLASLYAAYEVAIKSKDRTPESVIALGDLYELLTMLPGQARDYARQEFARDIYLLDQSGETTTKDGAHIEFHTGAGARVPRGALSIVTQNGQERKYHGISFVKT